MAQSNKRGDYLQRFQQWKNKNTSNGEDRINSECRKKCNDKLQKAKENNVSVKRKMSLPNSRNLRKVFAERSNAANFVAVVKDKVSPSSMYSLNSLNKPSLARAPVDASSTSRRNTFDIPKQDGISSTPLMQVENSNSASKVRGKKPKQVKYVESRIFSGIAKVDSSKMGSQVRGPERKRLSLNRKLMAPSARRATMACVSKPSLGTSRPAAPEGSSVRRAPSRVTNVAADGRMANRNVSGTQNHMANKKINVCNRRASLNHQDSGVVNCRMFVGLKNLGVVNHRASTVHKNSEVVSHQEAVNHQNSTLLNRNKTTSCDSNVPLSKAKSTSQLNISRKAHTSHTKTPRQRLVDWDATKDKTPSRFRHCRCFDVPSDLPSAAWNTERAESPLSDNIKVTVEAQEEDNQSEIQNAIARQISEITAALDSGRGAQDLLGIIDRFHTDVPASLRSAALWVCKAKLLLLSGDNDQVMMTFEKACLARAEPRKDLHAGMFRVIKQMSDDTPLDPVEPRMGDDAEPWLAPPPAHFLVPSEIATPRKRLVQQHDVFESSTIKFSVRTPVDKREQSAARGGAMFSPYTIVTPVRRSTRRSLATIPETLREKDRVYSSLVDLPASIRQGALFQPNNDLNISDVTSDSS